MSCIFFLCQRCNEPLKLLQKVSAMHGQPLDHASPSTEMPVSGEPQARPSCRPHPDKGGKPKESTSCCIFTLLGETMSLRTLNTIQDTVIKIYEILSGQKDVDHPLCVDCTDNLLRELDAQLAHTESDTQTYRSFLERELLVSEEEEEALQVRLRAELSCLEQEEAELVQELEDIHHHHARVASELEAAQAERKELHQQEQQHWVEYSALKMKQMELMDQLGSVENQLEYSLRQLRLLKETSVFNTTFTISDEGPLGIINNFRLGCLPSIQVGWDEINTAWGQAALLLFSLSKKAGLQFQRYQLVPYGDHSYLKSLTGDGALLLLFSDGSQSVVVNNKFDCGMKAFLDCLEQFVKETEKEEGCLCLPYRIHGKEGMLEDTWGSGECYSIRIHLNTEEEWTRAVKFMLTNLKLILEWASFKYCQN
ncbi:beclin-2 [Meriones unguiculatus]|uniref:beclin-2 n=1 Tax=Meriones unguiculatus TaxID=10047 RepID=UPI000B4F14DC|nr:beclin-2 [Meriones unguiculatus]